MKFQRGSIFKPEKEYYKVAGIILLIGAVQFLLAVNLAEALFPGYSVRRDTLSHLGGSIPIIEPSAIIFNISVILLGILSLSAVYLILKSGGCRLFSSCLAISAVGTIGVGLFPTYTGNPHIFFSILTFLFGSLATIFSYRLGLNIPMVILSMILGLVSLLTLLSLIILGTGASNLLIAFLGIGGTERFIAYPSLFYIIALGGYLTSRGKDWVRIRFTDGYW
ncbi:DUF998 domain-containing protein [Methanobacterium sp. ACI-7]|uniref:DUF998 domain-containing protein n=1 Tax=unclassified Methanobacterium TaxID=2627676 RepID=UPI0039C23763